MTDAPAGIAMSEKHYGIYPPSYDHSLQWLIVNVDQQEYIRYNRPRKTYAQYTDLFKTDKEFKLNKGSTRWSRNDTIKWISTKEDAYEFVCNNYCNVYPLVGQNVSKR